jgi:hypothetical protein
MSYKKITTIEAAFKKQGLDPKIMPDVSMLPDRLKKYMLACYILPIIFEAVNEGWTPDYTNSNQPKYSLWAYVDADKKQPGGFGFSLSNCDYSIADSSAGSRLSAETSDKLAHIFEHFKQLFIDHHLITE